MMIRSAVKGWAIFFFLPLIISSCGKKPISNYDLFLLTASPLGQHGGEVLPEYLIELIKPYKTCANIDWVAKIRIGRTDQNISEARLISPKISGGFAGDITNINFITRQTVSALREIKIGEKLTSPADEHSTRNIIAEVLKNKSGGRAVFFYDDTRFTNEEYNGEIIFSDIAELRHAIKARLCENEITSVFIFLNAPPEVMIRRDNDGFVAISNTLDAIEKINSEDARERYAREEAAKINAGRVNDYRIMYVLAKLNVYGVNHKEAFDLLKQAALMAVEQGESEYLLDRIEGEKDKDDALRKLSRGHLDDWHEIIEILEHGEAGHEPEGK